MRLRAAQTHTRLSFCPKSGSEGGLCRHFASPSTSESPRHFERASDGRQPSHYRRIAPKLRCTSNGSQSKRSRKYPRKLGKVGVNSRPVISSQMPVGARKFWARKAAPRVCLRNLPAVVRAKPGKKKRGPRSSTY